MRKRDTFQSGLTLNKETVWTFAAFHLPLDDRGIPVNPCFANLWTKYYCEKFTAVTYRADRDTDKDDGYYIAGTPNF